MSGTGNPQVTSYGNSFAKPYGDLATTADPKGDIIASSLGATLLQDTVQFNKFEDSIKSFILGRLGFPIVRVELTDFQIKSSIDEAITKLYYHAPEWMNNYLAIKVIPGVNIYELPDYVINNLINAHYKKALLTPPGSGQAIEFDYLYRYFNHNFVTNDFSMGEYYLFQISMEMLRKTLGQNGTFEVVNNRYLQVYPTPLGDDEIIVEYRAIDSNTIHPAYRNFIQRYALAVAKSILGQIRGKYNTLPGPGGGAQLNGERLIQESVRELEVLDRQIIDEFEEPPAISMY